VPAAARAGSVKAIEHSAAVQRAELDARLAQAQRAGDLGFLNREYARRRKETQAEGPFMSYSAAQARLRKALVGVAAGDQPGLMTRVFGGDGAGPPAWTR
jgi:hypothetical protein